VIGVSIPVAYAGAAIFLGSSVGGVAIPLLAVPVAAGYGVYRLARSNRARSERIPPRNVVALHPSWGNQFTFPPGHPTIGMVYAAHPVNEKYYIPIADFHRKVFEDRFRELVSILVHLGAKKIEVRSVYGWGRDFTEKLSVDLKRARALEEGYAATGSSMMLLYDDNLQGSDSPRLPQELTWYHHEDTWKTLVENRMNGSQRFNLNIFYNDDYGINVRLKAEIEDVRLNLGGHFEEYRATAWQVSGTY
jgi:hypothetical protein